MFTVTVCGLDQVDLTVILISFIMLRTSGPDKDGGVSNIWTLAKRD